MDKIIHEKVGERLKFARELRNISLEKAGDCVSVHKSTILRWENGRTEKFKLPALEKLAELYDVNPAWLMGYDVPMNKNEKIETSNNININGLNEDEIQQVANFVEFIKNNKKQNNKGVKNEKKKETNQN